MKQKWMRLAAVWMTIISCSLSVSAIPKTLIPGGCTVGVKLYTQGLIITGFESGSAAKAAGLKKGDVIVKADGEEIHTAAALRNFCAEDRVVLTVLRNGKEASFCVAPRNDAIGAYVKDSVAGIGTVTYYDPVTGAFGALGHGVCDAETEQLMPLEAGVVVSSDVLEVRKGTSGTPGELKGQFEIDTIIGEVSKNTDRGIFGTMTAPLQGKPMPVADLSEVQTGPATILANINGHHIAAYEVEIIKTFQNTDESDRNMLLRVIDQSLLNATGGIVQGMSGSPIIQDGKLVGAVTHVCVNQ